MDQDKVSKLYAELRKESMVSFVTIVSYYIVLALSLSLSHTHTHAHTHTHTHTHRELVVFL